MRDRPRWLLLSLGAVIVLLLFTYPVWRKFVVGRAAAIAFSAATEAQREVFARMDRDDAANAYVAMLTVVPAPTSEQPPPILPDAQAIRTGQFIELDALHSAKGKITIFRSADGSLLLRFDEFSVTNGPRLTVYLSGVSTPKTKDDLGGGGISEFAVGSLKGSVGNQQYPIPKELPIDRYKSVVLYSEDLKTIYSYAPIQPL